MQRAGAMYNNSKAQNKDSLNELENEMTLLQSNIADLNERVSTLLCLTCFEFFYVIFLNYSPSTDLWNEK